jgi:hypothetical protein
MKKEIFLRFSALAFAVILAISGMACDNSLSDDGDNKNEDNTNGKKLTVELRATRGTDGIGAWVYMPDTPLKLKDFLPEGAAPKGGSQYKMTIRGTSDTVMKALNFNTSAYVNDWGGDFTFSFFRPHIPIGPFEISRTTNFLMYTDTVGLNDINLTIAYWGGNGAEVPDSVTTGQKGDVMAVLQDLEIIFEPLNDTPEIIELMTFINDDTSLGTSWLNWITPLKPHLPSDLVLAGGRTYKTRISGTANTPMKNLSFSWINRVNDGSRSNISSTAYTQIPAGNFTRTLVLVTYSPPGTIRKDTTEWRILNHVTVPSSYHGWEIMGVISNFAVTVEDLGDSDETIVLTGNKWDWGSNWENSDTLRLSSFLPNNGAVQKSKTYRVTISGTSDKAMNGIRLWLKNTATGSWRDLTDWISPNISIPMGSFSFSQDLITRTDIDDLLGHPENNFLYIINDTAPVSDNEKGAIMAILQNLTITITEQP